MRPGTNRKTPAACLIPFPEHLANPSNGTFERNFRDYRWLQLLDVILPRTFLVRNRLLSLIGEELVDS
ncbi:MAG: hypothetical protein ACT4O2_07020, partial [Beijerinckiaceae bacterium]